MLSNPLLLFFISMGLAGSEAKFHHFRDVKSGANANQPQIRLPTSITTKDKTWSTTMVQLGKLPKSVMLKAKALYENGEMDKLKELSASLKRLKQLYLMQKCKAIFTADLCSNSSAQPFFIWAKMSANKIIQGQRSFQ